MDPYPLLNGGIRKRVLESPNRFARIGLAGAKEGEEKCWLMLDSLFPQPEESWLAQPAPRASDRPPQMRS
ncbi:MAG: hypothetical protein DMG21_03335 [Acidobacteria bacterium]|nr:MAG: hypothetical protein DMG21_03335 [Acidobacteriota bacterium]